MKKLPIGWTFLVGVICLIIGFVLGMNPSLPSLPFNHSVSVYGFVLYVISAIFFYSATSRFLRMHQDNQNHSNHSDTRE